uniref:DUF4258 domain-containing protein n=1 Tax=Candidatus Kentrum sp. TC TaxID=2126339 RepID=A0A450YSP2_9GAMM|nr:MAG: protein of unknown function (DUF4258) [Candidatus Kentron sp. TC]
MKPLSALRAHLVAGEFEFTQHAVKRMVERNISDAEIREAGGKAFIVEDYPDDKYGPSCLLLGFYCRGQALAHSSHPRLPGASGKNHHPLRTAFG